MQLYVHKCTYVGVYTYMYTHMNSLICCVVACFFLFCVVGLCVAIMSVFPSNDQQTLLRCTSQHTIVGMFMNAYAV